MDFCAGSGNNFPLTLANFQFCYFVWGKLCMLMASVSYHDFFLRGQLSLKSGSNLFIGMLFLLAWLVETNVTSTPMSQLTIVLIYVIILLSYSQSNGFILIMVCCTCDQTQPHTINAILMSDYSLTVKLLPSLLILYIISILLSFCVVLMHWSLKSVRCCCR